MGGGKENKQCGNAAREADHPADARAALRF